MQGNIEISAAEELNANKVSHRELKINIEEKLKKKL